MKLGNNMTFSQPHHTQTSSIFPKYVIQEIHSDKNPKSNEYSFCTSLVNGSIKKSYW